MEDEMEKFHKKKKKLSMDEQKKTEIKRKTYRAK